MTVQTPTCSPRAAQRKTDYTHHSHGWATHCFVFFWQSLGRSEQQQTWDCRIKIINISFFLADIQECYEVTLQLNKEQALVKDDSRADVWKVTIAKCAPPSCAYDPAMTVENFSNSLGPCHLNCLFPLTSLSQRRLWSHCRVSNPGQQGAWSLLHPSLSGSQLLQGAWAQSCSERGCGEVGAVVVGCLRAS